MEYPPPIASAAIAFMAIFFFFSAKKMGNDSAQHAKIFSRKNAGQGEVKLNQWIIRIISGVMFAGAVFALIMALIDSA